MSNRTTAIVLAAGQGKRMNSDIRKQYLVIEDKPVLYYALKIFEDSFIEEVVLVVGKGEQEYCYENVIKKYGFTKIRKVIEGGKERYHSVFCGLQAIKWECDYLFIHDGARPFITQDILKRAYEGVVKDQACVVGMPVKDTVKIADDDKYVESTPKRANVWQIQTPQVFAFPLILEAYTKLISKEREILNRNIQITDDAMVVEFFMNSRIKLVEGSYQNIKITTPEDLKIAKIFLN